MRKRAKQVLALFLALMMCVSLFPAAALAEEAPEESASPAEDDVLEVPAEDPDAPAPEEAPVRPADPAEGALALPEEPAQPEEEPIAQTGARA